jgi:hypothetical protein
VCTFRIYVRRDRVSEWSIVVKLRVYQRERRANECSELYTLTTTLPSTPPLRSREYGLSAAKHDVGSSSLGPNDASRSAGLQRRPIDRKSLSNEKLFKVLLGRFKRSKEALKRSKRIGTTRGNQNKPFKIGGVYLNVRVLVLYVLWIALQLCTQ